MYTSVTGHLYLCAVLCFKRYSQFIICM